MPRLDPKFAVGMALTAVFVAMPVSFFVWMTSVPGTSFSGPLPQLSAHEEAIARQLRTDVTAIASRPHNLAHPAALEGAAQYIERELAAAGFTPVPQFLDGPGFSTRNIEVVIEPSEARAETLIIGAHYDSAGDAPGANDNGSGAAALLAIARDLEGKSGMIGKRLRLVFFVNEEPPYFKTNQMGSLAFAEMQSRRAERVEGMISLETMGYFSDQPGSQNYPSPLSWRYPSTGNFIAFVGMTSSRNFLREVVGDFRTEARLPSVGGTAPGFITGIDWSDHWSFAQFGIPALMVTDTAPFRYRYYHKSQDTPEKLDYRRLTLVVSGLQAMLEKRLR